MYSDFILSVYDDSSYKNNSYLLDFILQKHKRWGKSKYYYPTTI